jgi:C4-type Zn-finger protein
MQPYVKVTRSIEAPTHVCPVCGDKFSHVQAVYTLLGSDESEGLYRGSHLVARETPYRRDAIAIRVHGETCGHRWDVVFQQHKGETFVRYDILEGEAAHKERAR